MSNELINQIKERIYHLQWGEASGHDWQHTKRVWEMAKYLAQKETAPVDVIVVELAALLHDVADWKFHGGDETAGPLKAAEWLEELGADEEVIQHVVSIIRDISYKGSENTVQMKTLEGKIVQDADRLDAVGYIGIARTFAYGGFAGHELYNPDILPRASLTPEQYKDRTVKSTTLNHFYEKLLLLKDGFHTEEAKKIGRERHDVMVTFVKGFLNETGMEESQFQTVLEEMERSSGR